jgi:hypothetical protein
MNFATQQGRKLAADGQPQTGAAILPAGAGIGLLKRLEDQLLLVERNADAGIRHLERDHGGRVVQNRMFGAPAAQGCRNAQANPTLGRELERV